MNQTFMGGVLRRLVLPVLGSITLASFLVACGGSGAGKGGDGPPLDGSAPPTEFLALSLLDANSRDVTQSPTVGVGSSLTLRIVATDAGGALLPNTLITVTPPTVATIVPASGTVLTDSTGVARVTVIGSTPGAGLLSASATISGETRTGTTPLTVTSAFGTAQSGLALSLFDANNADVSGSPQVAVGSQLTLRVAATDSSAAPVANTLITVTAPTVASLVPAVGTVMTNSLGVATIQVEGLTEGAGELMVAGTIDATATTASLSLTVTPSAAASQSPTALSVAYISASIQTLKIAGAVGESTSTLRFRVVNQDGQPVPNQQVTFTPSVTTGGLSLSPLVATTLADGTVTTNVTAGVIPTPVRVRAATTLASTGEEASAQSLQLSISSGNPSQRFFSLSTEIFNIDGCDFDGAQTNITSRAGDQFGNPVPDGTTVNFVTEGGRIGAASVGSCQTANGACSVVLESQEYRPKGYSSVPPYNNCRVSVLAYAVGEEAFNDANSSGIYDAAEPFEDLPDAFLNIEPLDRTPVTAVASFLPRSALTDELVGDRLIPFQSDGRTSPQVDGVWGQAHVRGLLEVVFSSRQATGNFSPDSIDFGGCNSLETGLTQNAVVILTDRNGNALAAGSAIAVDATGATAAAPSPATVPNTSSRHGTGHLLVITADPTRCAGGTSAGASGSVRVRVTPVGGDEQVFSLPVFY